jgi:DNA-binding NarL/FixJ family response regulator
MPVSVLLADDAEIFRRTIRGLLAKNPEIEVVGEAAHIAQTIQIANRLKPQVIVMDLGMCCSEPADVKKRLPLATSRLLVFSQANDVDAKLLAATIGASVLIDKARLRDELVPAILKLGASIKRAVGRRSKTRAN